MAETATVYFATNRNPAGQSFGASPGDLSPDKTVFATVRTDIVAMMNGNLSGERVDYL